MKEWDRHHNWLGMSPAMKSFLDSQRRVAELGQSPAMRSIFETQRKFGQSPAIKSIVDSQRKFAQSPAIKVFLDSQRRVAELGQSPAMRSIVESIRPATRSWQAAARSSFLKTYEAVDRFVDEHWAELRTEHPDHPQPVLFLVASFSVAIGAPLYEAVRLRDDDSALLDALETVFSDSAYIEEVQKAVQDADLPAIPKRHLTTALGWLENRQHVDAYPPFYNGLEPALRYAAEQRGVIANGRLVSSNKRVTKIDDAFRDLSAGDPRFRRFLSAWIFGDRGNPFRHGAVEDPSECRRQSLRLAVALVGWLELFGGWEDSDFHQRLEARAEAQLLTSDNATG